LFDHITGVAQSHSIWREGTRLAQLTRRRVPTGTVFAFTLNEAATVRLSFREQLTGRKVGRRCVAQSRANRHRHACARGVLRGSLTFALGQQSRPVLLSFTIVG
jgi:hypothetical protein